VETDRRVQKDKKWKEKDHHVKIPSREKFGKHI
jgi:hypothetical protein